MFFFFSRFHNDQVKAMKKRHKHNGQSIKIGHQKKTNTIFLTTISTLTIWQVH